MTTKKVFYLKTCDTSQRVIHEAGLSDNFDFQDIKEEPLTPQQLDQLAALAGSYEGLFNRRCKKYRERDLKNEYLNEKDYRDLILEHYTFLKRPVVVVDNQIFIGGSEKEIKRLMHYLDT
ncbi:MAG: hypothetical protein K9I68_04460 [Bacteroidales bacterium]|nr:hypothetical protein [Bacteroidales bacterium]MCF8338206.1 hypothetical protein [Bacteroidales bacterium]